MSMFESLGRYGAALKHAHNRHKSVRALNSLPADIQKNPAVLEAYLGSVV